MTVKNITFSDVCLEQQYSEILSRSEIDISTRMCQTASGKLLSLRLPVFSANMPQITGWKMATEMAKHGGIGILHRFCPIEEACNTYIRARKESSDYIVGNPVRNLLVGVSIGVKEEDKKRFEELYKVGARIFCIDIAHGHCKMMKDMISWIRKEDFRGEDQPIIIAGNIASARGALDLVEWGADILKVGIGPGKVCRTRSNTGVGKPQFSAILEIHKAIHDISDVTILADGGIKTTGDIAKALAAGADSVMVGAVLAGTSETPGNAFPEPGTDLTNRTYYKMYGGSASYENKVASGQKGRFVEGEMTKVPFKGHAKYLLREIKDGLQSALSYTGARNLKEFREKVQWSEISSGGKSESKF